MKKEEKIYVNSGGQPSATNTRMLKLRNCQVSRRLDVVGCCCARAAFSFFETDFSGSEHSNVPMAVWPVLYLMACVRSGCIPRLPLCELD